MKTIKLLFLFSICLISNTFAAFSPVEGVISDKNLSGFIFFRNTNNDAILFNMTIHDRSHDENGILRLRTNAPYSLPKDYLKINPAKFVLKKKTGQRIGYSIDKANVEKLPRAMYLMGISSNIEKVVNLREDAGKSEVSSAKIKMLSTITSSIIYFNTKKEDIFNDVKLTKHSFKNGVIDIEMSKHDEIFGLGMIVIEYSADKKTWKRVHRIEERFFSNKVKRTYKPEELKNTKTGYIRISYVPILRYKFKFKEYFSVEFKI